ncbi:hypothetical protein KFL_008750030 [Klebsormidium nitens]|uniref:Uncharacterized protein n=1 Tax=Klebsormidium nitens TaxID=105231 RepID=A0A1Y1IM56_KLENI|nr:hypothetical protein KFL_008750030 [Klebsormidium nitens]|eukprot:GAQ91884.1 hypothetical protein KFL_008750030 [Klebsormidium nitens]
MADDDHVNIKEEILLWEALQQGGNGAREMSPLLHNAGDEAGQGGDFDLLSLLIGQADNQKRGDTGFHPMQELFTEQQTPAFPGRLGIPPLTQTGMSLPSPTGMPSPTNMGQVDNPQHSFTTAFSSPMQGAFIGQSMPARRQLFPLQSGMPAPTVRESSWESLRLVTKHVQGLGVSFSGVRQLSSPQTVAPTSIQGVYGLANKPSTSAYGFAPAASASAYSRAPRASASAFASRKRARQDYNEERVMVSVLKQLSPFAPDRQERLVNLVQFLEQL